MPGALTRLLHEGVGGGSSSAGGAGSSAGISTCRATSVSGGFALAGDNGGPDSLCRAVSVSGGAASAVVSCRAGSVSGGLAVPVVTCRATSVSGGRAGGSSVGATFLNGYAARRHLELQDQGDLPAETFTDMPVHVRGLERLGWLVTAGNGGKVQNASGFDVRVEDEATSTKQAHRLLGWSASAGPAGLRLTPASWVSNQKKRYWLYYGKAGLVATEEDPAQTWRGTAQVNVWPAGTDDSGRGRGMTPHGVNAATLDGLAAGAFASASYAERASPTDLSGLGAFTEELWIRPTTAPVVEGAVARVGGTTPGSAAWATWVANPAGDGRTSAWSAGWGPTSGTVFTTGATNSADASLVHLFAQRQSGVFPSLLLGTVSPVALAALTGVDESKATPSTGTVAIDATMAHRVGAGTGSQTTAVVGTYGAYTLWSRALSPTFMGVLHRSQADAFAVVGLGDEELPGDTTGSPVARPAAATVVGGQSVTVDVAAGAYLPPGVTATLVSAGQPGDGGVTPQHGSAAVVAGKVQFTAAAASVALTDRAGFTLRGSNGKVSTSVLSLTITPGIIGSSVDDLPTPLRTLTVGVTGGAGGAIAFSTFAAAWAAALPGDWIKVHGTLPAATLGGKATTSAKQISILAVDASGTPTALQSTLGGDVIINGSYTRLWGFDLGVRTVTLAGSWNRLTRFKASGNTGASVNGVVHITGTDCFVGYGDMVQSAISTDSQGRGPRQIVADPANGARHPRIFRVYIHDSHPDAGNVKELINVGYDKNDTTLVCGALIENCLIANYTATHGEEEAISIKCSGNTVRRCTLVKARFISIRHGQNNTIEECYIDNQNAGAGFQGGIEARDLNCTIHNCQGVNGAIMAVKGGDTTCAVWDVGTPPHAGLVRTESAYIAHPNFSAGKLQLGDTSRGNLPALNPLIEHPLGVGSAQIVDVTNGSSGKQVRTTSTITQVAPAQLTTADVGPTITWAGSPA